MVLLVHFAVVAGAGTALTPCVLPVLPALLSASATGGRRRPLGVVLGLVVTHTVAIVGLATVIDGVGLADGTPHAGDRSCLVLFGLALLCRRSATGSSAPLSRLARFGPRDRGDGSGRALVVGGALGFVYAPCAGPILAAVVSVGATRAPPAELVAVALAYGARVGGRAAADRLRRAAASSTASARAGRGPALQRALGVVMVADRRRHGGRARRALPDRAGQRLPALRDQPDPRARALGRGRGPAGRPARAAAVRLDRATRQRRRRAGDAGLPVLGSAPDFTGNERWFNTPAAAADARAAARPGGAVDFWTYTCINCMRTLPYAASAWDERYRGKGLTIVGVHTPEFAFERKAGNVARAIAQNELRYPVAQDNEYATWNAWGNQYWPAKYLIDARGRVRYTHFGEGDYDETERAIRALLAEAGRAGAGRLRARAAARWPPPGTATPETYLGSERAQGFLPRAARPDGTATRRADRCRRTTSRSSGAWSVDGESATAVRDARLDARFARARCSWC